MWRASVWGLGAALMATGSGTAAAIASLEPLHAEAERYSTTIPATADPADIYYPAAVEATTQLPLVLLLQGALVDKDSYSNYASQLARYGFVVVVPNHERTTYNPEADRSVTGLIPAQRQIHDVLAFARAAAADADSPLYSLVDPQRLGVVGHSLGGAVGMSAIQNLCLPPACAADSFERPEALMAGVFYGASFQTAADSGEFPPINNDGIPMALISGSHDGIGQPSEISRTYAQIEDAPKAFISVTGANHYGITDADSPRAANPPRVEQAVANAAIARWSGLFLRAHLLNDETAFEYVYDTGDTLDDQVAVTSRADSWE